jgi:hypothetical protein
MNKTIIFIITLICFVKIVDAQKWSLNDDFYTIFQVKELKTKFGEHYLDSVVSFQTFDYNKDIKFAFKLRNLNRLIMDDSYRTDKDSIYRKIRKRLQPIPKTVNSIWFGGGGIPIPLPIDLSKHKNILEELYINDAYIPNDIDSVCLDFSDLKN